MPTTTGAYAASKMKMWWLSAAIVGVVMCGATSAAVAADFSYNWTGFYAGGNVGYGWGKAHDDVALSNPLSVFQVISPYTVSYSSSDQLKGITGGAQFGYNWQFSQHGILGLEADWQASGERTGKFCQPAADCRSAK
jgi:outer membrane immunogenic protein